MTPAIGLAQVPCGEFQNSAWTFGSYAGVTFNPITGVITGTPTSKVKTFEGSASLSDYAGNLLFYTDGMTVWNGNHTVMNDSAGNAVTGTKGLNGASSSTQAALIVPCACGSKYFIFTTDSSENYHLKTGKGLNYSVVSWDSLTQRWLVTTKNVLLMSEAAEKLAATPVKATGQLPAFWVVSHDLTNHFVTWKTQMTYLPNGKIDCSVVQASVTLEPTNYGGPSAVNGWMAGQMKLSPGGAYLAVARASFSANPPSPQYNGFVDVFRFNATTGAVTGLMTGPFPSGPFTTLPAATIAHDGAYGVEFSPDGRKLYVASTRAQNVLNQYTISTNFFGMPIVSPGSPLTIASIASTNYEFGALQIAPGADPPAYIYGDIYMARPGKQFLTKITSPNPPVPAVNTVNLNVQSTSQLGLPTFVSW